MLKRTIVSLFLLQGCALNAPYPDWMLKDADPYISSVEYLSGDALQAACALEIQVSGCARLLTGEIFVLDDYANEFRECVLRHERSHIYDVYVKKMKYEETQEHKHWIEPRCYLPRRVAGHDARLNGG